MTPEILFYHLAEIGINVSLGTPSTELLIDAPKNIITPELTELLREHKGDLIELVYEREERIAIEEEGQLSDIGRAFIKANKPLVTVADGVDYKLGAIAKVDPLMRSVAQAIGGLEIVSVCRSTKEIAA
jgi:hypothetical protein